MISSPPPSAPHGAPSRFCHSLTFLSGTPMPIHGFYFLCRKPLPKITIWFDNIAVDGKLIEGQKMETDAYELAMEVPKARGLMGIISPKNVAPAVKVEISPAMEIVTVPLFLRSNAPCSSFIRGYPSSFHPIHGFSLMGTS